MAEQEMQLPGTSEIMAERGEFIANGYTFTIEPIYYNEESAFQDAMPHYSGKQFCLFPRDKDGTIKKTTSDDELAKFGIMLFQLQDADPEEAYKGSRFKVWLYKHLFKDYRYYVDNPNVMGFIWWVEKKVSYKGRHIKFYQLERKFKLTKAEIIKMLGYLEAISGF